MDYVDLGARAGVTCAVIVVGTLDVISTTDTVTNLTLCLVNLAEVLFLEERDSMLVKFLQIDRN